MTTFSQITMKFVEETPGQQENQPQKEDQPLNIGIRIKKLKTAAPADTDSIVDLAREVSPLPVREAVVEQIPENQNKIKSGRGRKSIRQISEEADLIQIPND